MTASYPRIEVGKCNQCGRVTVEVFEYTRRNQHLAYTCQRCWDCTRVHLFEVGSPEHDKYAAIYLLGGQAAVDEAAYRDYHDAIARQLTEKWWPK